MVTLTGIELCIVRTLLWVHSEVYFTASDSKLNKDYLTVELNNLNGALLWVHSEVYFTASYGGIE